MTAKFLFILAVVTILHFFLDSTGLIIVWCGLGCLSATWLRAYRYPLLSVLAMELCTGLVLCFFEWRGNPAVEQLAENTNIPGKYWLGGAVCYHCITGLLCTGSMYYLTRGLLSLRKKTVNSYSSSL